MSELVSLTKDGEVAVITINNPPVNALSPGVPEGIAAAVEAISKDAAIKAAIVPLRLMAFGYQTPVPFAKQKEIRVAIRQGGGDGESR